MAIEEIFEEQSVVLILVFLSILGDLLLGSLCYVALADRLGLFGCF